MNVLQDLGKHLVVCIKSITWSQIWLSLGALGNGYAITSIIGRREIMEYAQKTFISSTFWSERIGPTAALATLNEMERVKSWIKISKIGKKIKKNWNEISEKFNLKLKIGGIGYIPKFLILK